MLGALESLLSAVVSDGMAGTKHDPDGELGATVESAVALARLHEPAPPLPPLEPPGLLSRRT